VILLTVSFSQLLWCGCLPIQGGWQVDDRFGSTAQAPRFTDNWQLQ
jgi:hypothetical protein